LIGCIGCIGWQVFQVEEYEKYLIQLTKATGVNFTRSLKRSTARDFKISLPKDRSNNANNSDNTDGRGDSNAADAVRFTLQNSLV
jgi:Fanconi anemia group I protein